MWGVDEMRTGRGNQGTERIMYRSILLHCSLIIHLFVLFLTLNNVVM
jgi:hypothetical protein